MKILPQRAGSLLLGLGFACSVGLLSGCVETLPPDVAYVGAAPPTAVVEVAGTAPEADMIWIRGYHRWDGHAYGWNAGRWEARPRANARWEDGRWVHSRRGWYWRDGRWR
ncbi:MAG: hypothetical protein ABI592_05015 [Acidobacteriota bacterium]